MKKTFLCILMGCMIIICSTGCSKMAPECADKRTVDLVVKAINDSLFDKDMITYIHKVSDIRTTKVDKDTGAYSCAAFLRTDLILKETGGDSAKKALAWRVLHNSAPPYDGSGKHFIMAKEIEYKSELTSENKHYVSVRGW